MGYNATGKMFSVKIFIRVKVKTVFSFRLSGVFAYKKPGKSAIVVGAKQKPK
jgi:hypothetical protein